MQSKDFCEALFTDPSRYKETLLCDRKKIISNLRDNRERAEFVRDVIALANSARMTRQPAYLLFGIDDNGEIQDLEDSLKPYMANVRKRAQANDWDEARIKECLWGEVLDRMMINNLVADHIAPGLAQHCRLEHGLVRGKQCAYLLIPPVQSPRPFQVCKRMPSKGEALLRREQCWIRIGESKYELDAKEISPEEFPYCYGFDQVPYITPSKWLVYFQTIATRFHEAALGILGYQDLSTESGELLDERMQAFLEDEQAHLLIIRGRAGMGKSIFLRRWAYNLAIDSIDEMDRAVRDVRYVPPTGFAPVCLSLRSWQYDSDRKLGDDVMEEINLKVELWSQRPEMPGKALDRPDHNWLLCLDGVDEIWGAQDQRHFVKGLIRFQREHPAVKTVLTTRPDITIAGFQDPVIVDIAPLDSPEIIEYLATYTQGEQLEEIVDFLQSDDELWKLCGVPAFLEGAATAWIDEFSPPVFDEVEDTGESVDAENSVSSVDSNRILPKADITVDQILDSVQASLESQVADTEQIAQELTDDISGQLTEDESETRVNEPIVVPIRLGRVLDRIHQRIWKRESNRKLVNANAPDEWFSTTADLAAQLDGHRPAIRAQDARSLYQPTEGLNWVLSLGVLEGAKQSGWIRFVTDLTKRYFAASFAASSVKYKAYDPLLEYVRQGTRQFWKDTLALVRDLSVEDTTMLEEYIEGLTKTKESTR